MLRQERKELLDWASAVSGLPLRHISEVQNGAVFCYIVSLICDLDLSLVNYDAQEECECLANFRLVQSVAKAGRVRGLNHKAKLAHWGRLAVCEADAWEFLAVLNRCLTRAGKGDLCTELEADATPPPPPLNSRQGKKRTASPLDSPSRGSKKDRIRRIASHQAKNQFDAKIKSLAEGLMSSSLSETDQCIPAGLKAMTVEVHAAAGDDAWLPSMGSSKTYERHYSGASTIHRLDSNPASSHSSISEQDQDQLIPFRMCRERLFHAESA